MDIILVAGLWLDSSVWDDVASELRGLGHRPMPVRLPGADDRSTTATLDDQVAAVLAAVDEADRPMVVGHSAASTLAWFAADRRPDAVRRAVLIGGWPSAEGTAYADFFPTENGVMPFPGWEPFEGADSADLDQAARQRMAAGTIPVPEGVSKAVVRWTDDRRLDVPVTVICPEFDPDDVQAMIRDGDIPELAAARHRSLVDLDSGHWPMLTRAKELAQLLDAATTET